MREIFVVFDPELLSGEFLAGRTAVVIDVLRATSSMIQALASGARRVVPVATTDQARQLKSSSPAGSVVLGGERGGMQIEGFDLGNSPQEFSPQTVAGKTVVMTTTNGTRAILMAAAAERLYVAALTNVGATARVLADHAEGDIVLVTSGTERRVSWEDTLAAGAIVERLADGGGNFHLTDSALIALEVWKAGQGNLEAAIRCGRGGRNVARLGLGEAFPVCAALDSAPIVARVNTDPLQIVVEK